MAKKNKASDTINKATPRLSPLCTAREWLPKYVPSAIISLNQNDIDNIRAVKLKNRLFSAWANPWKVKTPDVVRLNRLSDVYKGQGEGETRWKGWAWKFLLFIFSLVGSSIQL